MSKRVKVPDCKGVYYRLAERIGKPGVEKVYYVTFKVDGQTVEEKAGRQYADNMTPAKAVLYRSARIEGRTPSRKEIREAAAEQKKAAATRWTIERLWKEYKSQRPQNRSLAVDENRFDNHLKAEFGNKEPFEVIPLDVDRLRLRLLKKRSPQTVKHVMGLLRRVCRFGAKKGLCAPLSFSIEMPAVDNLKTEDLTPKQLEKLLAVIEAHPSVQARGIMKMALYTGMRASEIFRLQWSDCDFERGFITLRNPKGGRDQVIPMNDAARKLLKNHPKYRSNRGKGPVSPFVFPGKGGRQRATVSRYAQQIRKDAGLPADFRPLHGLRHVYASMLASSGKVDLYTLQKLLTHKSPIMTQRYAHLRDDALKSAANVAGGIITDSERAMRKREKKKQAKGKVRQIAEARGGK